MSKNKLVLALAVFREFTENGARLDSLTILHDNEEKGWETMFRGLKNGQFYWHDLMGHAYDLGGTIYTYPMDPFDKPDPKEIESERDRLIMTMLHPIILEGFPATAMEVTRNLLNQSRQQRIGHFVPTLTKLCKIAAASDSDIVTDALNQIITQIVSLKIPDLIPYEKSELEYYQK